MCPRCKLPRFYLPHTPVPADNLCDPQRCVPAAVRRGHPCGQGSRRERGEVHGRCWPGWPGGGGALADCWQGQERRGDQAPQALKCEAGCLDGWGIRACSLSGVMPNIVTRSNSRSLERAQVWGSLLVIRSHQWALGIHEPQATAVNQTYQTRIH